MKINTREFDRAMKVYREHTKRDLATIFNTKGFFISRRATVETKKADASEIKRLSERVVIGTGTKTTKKGKTRTITVRSPWAETRAAKILQAKRRADGEKELPESALGDAVKRFIGARLRSIAFLKAGFIPAIKAFEPLAERRGMPPQDRSAKQYGAPKGSAIVARPGWKVKAAIINHASARNDNDGALIRYAGEGLQRAFNFEAASMMEYVRRKLVESAKKQGIRTR